MKARMQGRPPPKPGIARSFLRLVPVCYRAAPLLFVSAQLVNLLHGLVLAAVTLFQQRFFDSATSLATGTGGIGATLWSLAALGGVYILAQILSGAGNFFPEVYADKAFGKLSRRLHQKLARISPEAFESRTMLEAMAKAEHGKAFVVFFVMLVLIILCFYLPYFLFMSLYLFSLKPVLALAIALVFLPTLLSHFVKTRVFAKLEDDSAPVRRQREYYESCLVSREYYKETRLLGGYGFFIKRLQEAMAALQALRIKAQRKTALYELAVKLVALAGYAGILLLLLDALLKQQISVGAFAAVFASIGQLFSIMEQALCVHMGEVSVHYGSIQYYLQFLDLPERGGKSEAFDKAADITVEKVGFAYPEAERDALQDISFGVRQGQTVAVVGENGSGKSTLVRLLTGLYLPREGQVAYGGGCTQEYAPPALYKGFSAVFQSYQRYGVTLGENIAISDIERPAEPQALLRAAGQAGLSPESETFPQGLDTLLSREFGGVELSGGQWQRVAIARCLYRPSDVVFLDEPTAAISPLEEVQVYRQFARLAKGKTAFIVTHRIGSARLADTILVMKQGRLVEKGAHADLLAAGGEYARLYKAQQQWYS